MNEKRKLNLYYQCDITRSDGGYYHIDLAVFESEDLTVVFSPNPVLTFKAQSHAVRESDGADKGRAFIPNGTRHNALYPTVECVPWYALRTSCTSERIWQAGEDLKRAGNLAGRINARIEKRHQADYKAGECSENPDALLPIIRALVELRAVPVRYGDKGRYEIAA